MTFWKLLCLWILEKSWELAIYSFGSNLDHHGVLTPWAWETMWIIDLLPRWNLNYCSFLLFGIYPFSISSQSLLSHRSFVGYNLSDHEELALWVEIVPKSLILMGILLSPLSQDFGQYLEKTPRVVDLNGKLDVNHLGNVFLVMSVIFQFFANPCVSSISNP